MFGSVILIDFTNEELDIIENSLGWLTVDPLKAEALRRRITQELGKRIYEAGLVKKIDNDTFIVGDLK